MPKKAKDLSALEVGRIRDRGLHAVGGVAGLHMLVASAGSRSWILRTMVGGKRRDIGLGGFPDVPLADARRIARDIKERIRFDGVDPVAERQAARQRVRDVVTFDDAAKRLIEAKRPEWKNAKHAEQWRNTLKTYASPVLGRLPVGEIEVDHVRRVLEPIWQTKTETASRVRMRIEAVLSWAIASKLSEEPNPARWKGNLEFLLAKASKVSKRSKQPALPYDRLPEFMDALRKREGLSARALELAILTATRSEEIAGATWAEFDLDKAEWIIPAERMKGSAEHRVPLSEDAVALLRSVPRFAGSDYVFIGMRGDKMSPNAMRALILRMQESETTAGRAGWMDPRADRVVVPHGFRSTFRDWAAERTSYPNHVAEMALAHKIGNAVEAAYRRGDMLEKRRHMMEEWATFARTPAAVASVTPIRRKRAG